MTARNILPKRCRLGPLLLLASTPKQFPLLQHIRLLDLDDVHIPGDFLYHWSETSQDINIRFDDSHGVDISRRFDSRGRRSDHGTDAEAGVPE